MCSPAHRFHLMQASVTTHPSFSGDLEAEATSSAKLGALSETLYEIVHVCSHNFCMKCMRPPGISEARASSPVLVQLSLPASSFQIPQVLLKFLCANTYFCLEVFVSLSSPILGH